MTLTGRYFAPQTSRPQPVTVELRADATLAVAGVDVQRVELIESLQISERIGSTQRRITFADGALCELSDNDALDAWLTAHGAAGYAAHIHAMESRWRLAIGALVITIAVIAATLRWGLPALASRAAAVIPPSIDQSIGAGGLKTLDATFLKPSSLSAERQGQLQAMFRKIATDSGDHSHDWRLALRGGGQIRANAIALPSGIVILTDELVVLARHDEELIAVLAHEVGHVTHRHALRSLMQNSTTALISLGVLGDVSGATALIASIPTVLVRASYSREFESEADASAYAYLRRAGIATHFFGDILTRLAGQRPRKDEDGAMDFFATHPRPEERVRAADETQSGE